MIRASLIMPIVTLGCLLSTPVFAAPAGLQLQIQQFHQVLDTYDATNAELRSVIETRVGLNDQARNYLLSFVKQGESELLALRAKLWSTSSVKPLKTLAMLAKNKREAMKRQELRVIKPLLELNELRVDLLPTAHARLLSLETTVTKKQHDSLASTLASIEAGAMKLETQLLSGKPPADAPAQVRKLQTRLKNFYGTLRKIVE